MRARRLRVLAVMALALLAVTRPAGAEGEAPPADRTPPRLAFTSGQVSFWRPGASEWSPARVNTPLAPGDLLYAAPGANIEVQIGSRAFVRASGGTQLGLETQEPDFLQFKVTGGHVAFDLREVRPGHTVEVATPNAAFAIERTGYYVIDASGDRTSFVARRGGRATATPAAGQPTTIAPSEQVVITGAESPVVETYVAPQLSEWDRWNYARTDALLESLSARYVPSGVYGVDDLDHHGTWRVVTEYGPVWVPDRVSAGWAPYSIGRWIWDPYFGWTWLDEAPWGWAPYHYGRWVFVSGYWSWAPGPIVVRPYYAPALVAFFGFGRVTVGIGHPVGWVALAWGEPVIPWWGPVGFIGRPWWAAWGGPRIVNHVVVHKTTVVNVTNINVYRNVSVTNAVISVPASRFGVADVTSARLTRVETSQLAPVHGVHPVKPVRESLLAATGPTPRPAEELARKPVVVTRPPHDPVPALQHQGLPAPAVLAPKPKVVAAPERTVDAPERAPFGKLSGPERPRPPQPPHPGPADRVSPASRTREAARAQPQPTAPATSVPPAARPDAGERPGRREGVPTAPQPGAPAGSPRPEAAERPGAARRELPTPPRATAPQPPAPVAEPPARREPKDRQAPARPETRDVPTPPAVRTGPAAPTPGAVAPDDGGVPAPRGDRPPRAERPQRQERSIERTPHAPAPSSGQVQAPRQHGSQRDLPGEPANRLYPGQPVGGPGRGDGSASHGGQAGREHSGPRPR